MSSRTAGDVAGALKSPISTARRAPALARTSSATARVWQALSDVCAEKTASGPAGVSSSAKRSARASNAFSQGGSS